MEMRKCKRCEKMKPVIDFYTNRTWCKKCHSKFSALWYQINREKILEKQKHYRQENPKKAKIAVEKCHQRNRNKWKKLLQQKRHDHCWRCGYNTSIFAIDQHHIDPNEKNERLAMFVTRAFIPKNIKAFLNELKKTIALCANCHRELHAGLWNISEIQTDRWSIPEEE